ncbi:MAG TPA: hypothetical protein VJL29_04445 [Thermoguttaceae bacterium]|nr:hypothetical protein [Thermoguttaceae bacterium]
MKYVVTLVTLLMLTVASIGCKGPHSSGLPPMGSLVGHNTLPPADVLMHPGPGVDGPGPGVMVHQPCEPMSNMPSQVAFVGPDGMAVSWDVTMPGQFDSTPLVCPGRYNFGQGAIYRLKLTNVPGRPGVELYPTLEVGPAMPRTSAFLAHNAIPVQFTEEDFDQVQSGNFVTKVIYLPDPEFQEMALAGVETLVSTRLDPGMDPIVEADRRGSIMAVVRLGNKDLEMPGEAMDPGNVTQASYNMTNGGPCDCNGQPMPMATGMPSSMPMNYISGVTGPQYGMPMCGTPIGLPGPPHVPLGIPAGLQKHVIKNHTCVHIPKPTRAVKIDVKQKPGYSYPKPVNHVRIEEHVSRGLGLFHQPLSDKVECIRPGCEGVPCDEVPCEGTPCEGEPCDGTSCDGGQYCAPDAEGN